MNYISKQYLRFTEYVLTNKNIYQIICLGILSVILFAISDLTRSQTVELWSSLLSGFTFGLFLVSVPALISYYKLNRQQSIN